MFDKKIGYDENEKLLVEHVTKLRALPDFRASTVVFVPESNLGFEGWHLGESLERSGLKNIVIMKEDYKEGVARPGIRITHELKERLTFMLQSQFVEKSIYLYSDFFCVSQKTSKKMLDEMENQLLNYARIRQDKKNPHSKPTVHYGGKSGYGYDDVVCAWYLLLLARRLFNEKAEYASARH